MADAIPDWLAQLDAQRGQPALAPSPAPAPGPQGAPDWLTQMDQQRAAAANTTSAAKAPVVPQAPTHAVAGPQGGYGVEDAYNFLRTALVKAGSGLLGTLAATPNPLIGIPGKDTPGLDDATSHFADLGYKATGPEYQPSSKAGQYGMSGTTGALAALSGGEGAIPNALRGGAAGIAAQGAQDAGFPAWWGPLATLGTEYFARKAITPVVKPSLSSGADAHAGQIINETGSAPPPGAVPAIRGLRLSNGQLTGNSNALAMERDIADDNAPQVDADNLSANHAVINRYLATTAPGPVGSEAAAAQAANTSAAQKAAWKKQSDAWKAIPPDVSVDTVPLKAKLDEHITGVTANGDDDLLPNGQITRIQGLPDNAPLSALQARRSRLVTDASDARAAGQNNSARVIGGVADLLGKHIDDEQHIITGAPEDMSAYRAARAGTRDYYATYGDDAKAGAQIEDLTKGKIAPESTLSRFLPPGAEGTGTQSLARLKAASGTGAGLDPARSYLVGKLQDAIKEGPDAFDKVMEDYRYAFNDKDVFTSAQRSAFNDAREAVVQVNRQAERGAVAGSKTLAGLQSGSFARTLYGNILGTVAPAVSKAAGAAVGTAVAKLAPVLGDKEIAGTLFGGEAGADLFKGVSVAARDNVIRVLRAASEDPQLARELSMKASAANLKIAPRLQSMLRSYGLATTSVLPQTPSP